MGSCTWFGALSGNGLPREKDLREGEAMCCRAVWRRTGQRKENYNMGVPTVRFGAIFLLITYHVQYSSSSGRVWCHFF